MDDVRDGFDSVDPARLLPAWYSDLFCSVSRHIAAGRSRAVDAATQQLVLTFWHMGRKVLERRDREGYGTRVIDRLSADIKRAFPDATRFSPRNLEYLRDFTAAWSDPGVAQRSVAQLPCGHQVRLLDKLESEDARLWDAGQAIEHGRSRDVLAFQIQSKLRGRSRQAITNFGHTLPSEQSDLAQQAAKNPYLFDFLGAAEPILERDLLEHVSGFLLELGEEFALVGKQVRLTLGGDEVWCYLLCQTQVRLRRYVVAEFQTVAFKAEWVGQLGMYLAAVDLLARDDEKPTIGLLLCTSKNSVVAEYAFRDHAGSIGVAEWATSITDNLPADLAADLPSIETLEAELSKTVQEDAK